MQHHPSPSSRPKHAAVRDTLEERIRQMAPGEALSSERDLSTDLGVARMTLRRAVDALVAEGLLTRRPGAGTFVSPRRVEERLQATSFSRDMRARGLEPGSRTLSSTVIAAGELLADRLGLSVGEQVLHIRRLRTADGSPMAVEDLHVPVSLTPGLDGAALENASFYDVLAERFGLRIAGGVQTARACLVEPDDADVLGIDLGQPVFAFERISRLADGRIIEFVRSVHPGDRYQIIADILPEPEQR